MKYKLLTDITHIGKKGDIVIVSQDTSTYIKNEGRSCTVTMSSIVFDILLHTGMIEKYTEPVTYTLENPPKNGTVYYRLYYYGVDPATWEGSPFDWCSLFIGNCYATSEQAEQEYKKVKDIIVKNMA